MEKTYEITNEKFLEAKRLIVNNGGMIFPNGGFEISGVEGRFSFRNDILQIEITDKPFFASWDMIEEKLNEFFD